MRIITLEGFFGEKQTPKKSCDATKPGPFSFLYICEQQKSFSRKEKLHLMTKENTNKTGTSISKAQEAQTL